MAADDYTHPISGWGNNNGGLSTEHAAAVIVIGALLFLIAVKRGFRGVNVGGITVGVK